MNYKVVFDSFEQDRWDRAIGACSCASIYQSWWYGHVHGSESLRSLSTAVLLDSDGPVIMAAFRIKRLPIGGIGVAESSWAPLWRGADLNDGRAEQMAAFLEGVREEYNVKRRLEIRFEPCSTLSPDVDARLDEILRSKGFYTQEDARAYRTFMLDLNKSLDELRKALHQKWRNQLNVAEKSELNVQYGHSTQMFDRFVRIYDQMWQEKRFATGVRIPLIRKTVEQSKGKQFLIAIASLSGEDVGATVCTMAGQTVLYFLGATAVNLRQDSRPGYLLQWRNIQEAKLLGYRYYDTGGVPDDLDSGVYRFKERMNGTYVKFPGRYVCHARHGASQLYSVAEKTYQRFRSLVTGK
jgi:hypothetical protein